MRKLTGVAFAMVILVLEASTLRAADRLVPEDGAFEVMLLRQSSVREDLKLSHKEASKIDHYTSTQWEKAKEINNLPEAERDKKFEEMSIENHHFIEKTITKEQRKRLKEIELQVAGLMCVTRPEVAKKLNLTADQKVRAHEMQKQAREEMEQLLYASKPSVKKEKLDELHIISRDRLVELLTDEQEKTWEQMTGAPFKGKLDFGSEKEASN